MYYSNTVTVQARIEISENQNDVKFGSRSTYIHRSMREGFCGRESSCVTQLCGRKCGCNHTKTPTHLCTVGYVGYVPYHTIHYACTKPRDAQTNHVVVVDDDDDRRAPPNSRHSHKNRRITKQKDSFAFLFLFLSPLL